VYLLIDVTGDDAAPGKASAVENIVPTVIDALAADHVLFEQVHLSVITFGAQAYVELDLCRPADVRAVGSWLSLRSGRSWAAALDRCRTQIRADTARLTGRHLRTYPALVLLVTDGPVSGDEAQHAQFAIAQDWDAATVIPLWWAAGPPPPGLPEYPRGVGVEVVPAGTGGPASTAAELIINRATETFGRREGDPRRWDVQPARKPSPRAKAPVSEPDPDAGPEWTGSFTPYSVGDPGNAAALVRPVPDPSEWDRRDTVLDGVCIRADAGQNGLELRAASVRGLSHRYYGTVRQDEYAFRRTDDGRHLIAVVSDGVSNSSLSHKAAILIARTGAAELAGQLTRTGPDSIDWPGLVRWLSGEIVRLAARYLDPADGDPADAARVAGVMAATALFAVVPTQPVGDVTPAHVFSVGDSSAWVLRGGQRWESTHPRKNDGTDLASSRTDALPARTDRFHPPVSVGLRTDDVLVLMSDGIGDPLGDGSGPVGRFLAREWARPPLPLAFGAQVEFARRSHDDDRTAVAIWHE
jgi:uncharacterized protein YegL